MHEIYLGYIELLAIVLLFKVLCLFGCIKLENNSVLVWSMIPIINMLDTMVMDCNFVYYLITRKSQLASRIKCNRSSSCMNDGTARIQA